MKTKKISYELTVTNCIQYFTKKILFIPLFPIKIFWVSEMYFTVVLREIPLNLYEFKCGSLKLQWLCGKYYTRIYYQPEAYILSIFSQHVFHMGMHTGIRNVKANIFIYFPCTLEYLIGFAVHSEMEFSIISIISQETLYIEKLEYVATLSYHYTQTRKATHQIQSLCSVISA